MFKREAKDSRIASLESRDAFTCRNFRDSLTRTCLDSRSAYAHSPEVSDALLPPRDLLTWFLRSLIAKLCRGYSRDERKASRWGYSEPDNVAYWPRGRSKLLLNLFFSLKQLEQQRIFNRVANFSQIYYFFILLKLRWILLRILFVIYIIYEYYFIG